MAADSAGVPGAPGADTDETETEPPNPSPVEKERPAWSRALRAVLRSRLTRLGFLLLVVALLVAALVDQGGEMVRDFQKLSVVVILVAFLGNLGALVCGMMIWRVLLADMGSPISVLDAWRINSIAQLGKYVPGKVWQIVAQAELSNDVGVPKERSAVSALLTLVVTLVVGALVGAVTLPFGAGGRLVHYLWFLLVVPLGVVVLSPPVMNRILARALKILKRPPMEKPVSLRGLFRASLWALMDWLCYGVSTFLLLHRLGDHHLAAFLVATGAYSLSWVVGFLALIAPAGIGAREAVLVALLSSRVTGASALAVALLTRGLAVVADAVAGLSAVVLLGRGRLRRLRAARVSAED